MRAAIVMKQVDLEEFTADQLLVELRARGRELSGGQWEVESGAFGARELFSEFSNTQITRVLLRKQKLLYGVDSRSEVCFAHPFEQRDADSVLGVFRAGSVIAHDDGTWSLALPTLSDFLKAQHGAPLSERNALRHQPIGPAFTAVLVAHDLVLTAGHAVTQRSLPRQRFGFGFRMATDGRFPERIPRSELYRGVEVIDSEIDPSGEDWALIKLDRPVSNHAPARLRRNTSLAIEHSLHVIGHPLGLPLKVARGSGVRDNSRSEVFVANLDAYGGGIGSPVFNSETHEVEGILIRGNVDNVRVGETIESMICPDTGCLGHVVTRASLIPLPGEGPSLLRLRRPHTRGTYVKRVQEALVRAGFDLQVDGVFGAKTRAVVKAFQRREGLNANGIVDPVTRAELDIPG